MILDETDSYCALPLSKKYICWIKQSEDITQHCVCFCQSTVPCQTTVLVVWVTKLEIESNTGQKPPNSTCCPQSYTKRSKKARLLHLTCKHHGKRIHKIPQSSLILSGTSQWRCSSSPQVIHGDGWRVYPTSVPDSQLLTHTSEIHGAAFCMEPGW